MGLFTKKETVFEKRDRAACLAAREALEAAGISRVRMGHCETEPPVGGCGCKLDIRNFGPNGRIDRETYFLEVPAEEADRARGILNNMNKL